MVTRCSSAAIALHGTIYQPRFLIIVGETSTFLILYQTHKQETQFMGHQVWQRPCVPLLQLTARDSTGNVVCRSTTRDSHIPCLWVRHLIRGPWRSFLPPRSTVLTPQLVGGDLTHSCRVRAGVGQGPDALPIHPVGPFIYLYCRGRHRGVPGVDLRS